MVRTWTHVGIGLGVCIFLLLSAQIWAKPPVATIEWQHDLKEAHKLAVETNRPMLVVFDAPWCRHCKKFEDKTLSDPALVKFINTALVPVHLNADENQKAAEILEVKYLPYAAVLNPEADVLGEVSGYIATPKFKSFLEEALVLDAKLKNETKPASNQVPAKK